MGFILGSLHSVASAIKLLRTALPHFYALEKVLIVQNERRFVPMAAAQETGNAHYLYAERQPAKDLCVSNCQFRR